VTDKERGGGVGHDESLFQGQVAERLERKKSRIEHIGSEETSESGAQTKATGNAPCIDGKALRLRDLLH